MKSHLYRIDWRTVIWESSFILLFFMIFAILANVWLSIHPDARAAAEPLPVKTIIAHKWELSTKSPADLLLIGDSSCLMNVDALLFEDYLAHLEQRPVSVINLGLVSTIRMDSFGKLIERATAANPNRVKRIVLLVHPEMLRRQASQASVLDDESIYPFLSARTGESLSFREKALRMIGLDLVERTVLWRYLPAPQANQWGAFYGFQTGVREYLNRHKGSAVEATTFRGKGTNSRFTLAENILEEARQLRATIPAGVELTIGLTPTAAGFVGERFEEEFKEMRQRWTEAIQPDRLLTNLPAVLPDSFFGTHTHLTKDGQRAFTRWLAEQVKLDQP